MYFHLHSHCRLVEGIQRGAIYNLKTGKVYSVNKSAVDLLKQSCQQPLETLPQENSDECRRYFDRLSALDLGSYDPAEAPGRPASSTAQPPCPRLDFMWLEITGRCNNACLHCYASCQTGTEAEPVPHSRWLELVSEGKQAGATAVQLIGGEPLCYPGWRSLVEKARQEGYSFIEVFTNATLIDDDAVRFFRDNEVHIATTLYAGIEKAHDRVTQNPGSFRKTVSAIQKITAAGIPLRIASVVMKANENEVAGVQELCRQFGVEAGPPDVVRPTGRGQDAALMPERYRRQPIAPPFVTDEESFYHFSHFHSCLAGKLAVTSTGDIIPCIFARSLICGNILRAPLAEIIAGEELRTAWLTTKDHVDKCRDCEYRYACPDCRPLAQSSHDSQRWLACSAGCSYNPYTGIWADQPSPITPLPVSDQ